MLKKLLAIVLLLHIGYSFAQNSVKPPNSPFSFQNGQATLDDTNLKDAGLPQVVLSNDFSSNIDTNNAVNSNPLSTTNIDAIPEAKRKEYLNNLVERIIEPFDKQWSKYVKVIQKSTLKLFLYLMSFMILWRLIKFIVRGQYDISFWLIDTILLVISIKLISLLIMNADVISDNVINIFRDVAVEATGIEKIKPSIILELAVKYLNTVTKFVFTLNWQDLLKGLVFISIAGATALVIVGIVARYVIAIVETLILAKINVIYIAFYGVEQLRQLSIKPIVQWINIGIKLMFLQLMLGLEFDILNSFIKLNEINIYMIFSVGMSSFLMLIITWTIPRLLDNLILGSVNVNASALQNIKDATNAIKNGVSSIVSNPVKNAGGVTQLVQSYQAYQQALKNQSNINMPSSNNFGSGNNSNNFSTAFSGDSKGFNTAQAQSSSFNNSNYASTSDNKAKDTSSISNNYQPQTTNANQATQTAQANINHNQTSSSNTSIDNPSTSSKLGSIKQFMGDVSKGAIDMGKKSISEKFRQTPAGKMASYFDNKTQEIQKYTSQAQIDSYYQNLRQGLSESNQDKDINANDTASNIIEKYEDDKKNNKD